MPICLAPCFLPLELGAVAAQAADYLKADCLLDLTCAAVANAAKGANMGLAQVLCAWKGAL